MEPHHAPRRFLLGQTVATREALAKLSADDILQGFKRHSCGDWGELDDEDKKANDRALANDGRLVSAYRSAAGVRFYIITEHDRSYTTVLLPHEY